MRTTETLRDTGRAVEHSPVRIPVCNPHCPVLIAADGEPGIVVVVHQQERKHVSFQRLNGGWRL